MPSAPGVKTSFAPSIASSVRRSTDIVSGMVRIKFVALGRRDERQRDAGVAAGRLDDHGVFLEHAALLGILNHGHADAVFDAAERIEKFAFEENRGRQAGGDLVQFDQRRASDGFDDVVVDASHNNPFQTRLIDFVSQDCNGAGTRARVFSSIEEHPTSNIELRTSKVMRFDDLSANWLLDVGRSMFLAVVVL